MSYIRKKVNFCMVYFPFFLLFKFLHLPTMLSITPPFKIKECIDRATNNQQCINKISPNRKIKRRKNMDAQGYPFFIPYPVAIGNFHPESVVTIPQVGVSDDGAFTNRQPVCIKAVQLIHYLTHPWSLEVQCRHTERE